MQGPAFAFALLLMAAQQPASNPLERPPDLSAFGAYYPGLPSNLRPPAKAIPISGHVVLYNSYEMTRTAQMDLFIKVEGKNEFLRLIYCPYNCGFDAPAATPEMIPPREMIKDGGLRWTFQIVPGEGRNERHLCAFPRIEVADGHGGYTTREFLDVYKPPPHIVEQPPPDLHTPACFTVVSWSRAASAAAPDHR